MIEITHRSLHIPLERNPFGTFPLLGTDRRANVNQFGDGRPALRFDVPIPLPWVEAGPGLL